MKYLSRNIEKSVKKLLSIFPVIAVTGPRQSGKTTLLKYLFSKDFEYVSFDDPLHIEHFEDDPKGFIEKYNDKTIFDEVQRVPELFHYIKLAVDQQRQKYGRFILTGSSQFSMIRSITESLAGRIGNMSLLPMQYSEMPTGQKKNQLLLGSYPEMVRKKYQGVREWYSAYLSNYIERDVRSLLEIVNLRDFQRLISLLAARVSQELNMSNLAGDIGVSVKTIQKWVSVIEASYVIFLVPQYHKNFGKRIVKRPKIYFYDTGLICFLTGIRNQEVFEHGPLTGAIFECYIISEIKKSIFHYNKDQKIYYFRSNLGLEVDLIVEDFSSQELSFLEIKHNSTLKISMLHPIKKLLELESREKPTFYQKSSGLLIYKGKDATHNKQISAINYQNYLDKL